MKNWLYWYSAAITLVLAAVLFFGYENASSGDYPFVPEAAKGLLGDRELPQTILPVSLNRPFDFAGEPLPMEKFDVRERLDRELTLNSYTHGTTLLNIKSMYRYFPLFEKILKEHGIPEDFKYAAVAESNLRNAVSPAGARGIWQIMAPTAQQYGLEINDDVDERYHPEKATHAACKLLNDYYRKFGNWTLTAAAYNIGGPRLAREKEAQMGDSFYDLNLNEETSRYIFRLVAIKAILAEPKAFGFLLDAEHGYPPLDQFKVVEVNQTIPSLAAFAKARGISYRTLKLYNPWLISTKLNNPGGKVYQIKVPANQ
jgi:membrane-bound lytic murein transglycosylase D